MNKKTRAFTLVELLVVIGIIALLISILLPSLARARQQAASVQCLSNLRQQGQAALMYANASKGYLPHSLTGAVIYAFPQSQAELIAKTLKGDTKIFYCPTNGLQAPGTQPQIVPDDFCPTYRDPTVTWSSPPSGRMGRILYWWVGNPNAPDWDGNTALFQAANDDKPRFCTQNVFRDVDGDGLIRDQYMRKVGDKGAAEIVISTDWSGQIGGANRGWTFIHGRQTWMSPTATAAERKKLYRTWKNNLYGDGHCESKRPDEVEWRWGPNGPACW